MDSQAAELIRLLTEIAKSLNSIDKSLKTVSAYVENGQSW